MEIRDPVHGTLEINPMEVAVIDSPAFQRLRNIKQLGFGQYSFPGGVHSRFIHSLGVCHLAGVAFDTAFRGFHFPLPEDKWRLRQTVRLAALLHDVGHGPLSHTTEEVMPDLKKLNIPIYKNAENRQSNHEDYTIKIVTDSNLSETIKSQFSDIDPEFVAGIIDRGLDVDENFYIVNGINTRNLLSQIVSSELDVDRMDYLVRDSHFCGTSYGQIELTWLMDNLGHYIHDGHAHLSLNRRALYTFDDFLISRHHMYLIVYFHHKAIIYDEMLIRYLNSDDCSYSLPPDIDEYLEYTDYHLDQHLRKVTSNHWAKRIADRRPYRVLFELHETSENPRVARIRDAVKGDDIDVIHTSSVARLSKYHSSFQNTEAPRIFVKDQYDPKQKPDPIEEMTRIFQRYEENRRIDRLYVSPEEYDRAKEILRSLH